MSNRFQAERPDDIRSDISRFPPLPPWLRKKLLRPGEEVTWVRGPRWCPAWEEYATHPIVFLVGLALGAICLGGGRLVFGSWEDPAMGICLLISIVVVVGSICVLGVLNGHFTRLVVTTDRIVIMQGYEILRSYSIDSLPRSLIHHSRDGDEEERRTVDVGALQKMLGGSSAGFVEAKAVWDLGKQLDQFKKDRRQK